MMDHSRGSLHRITIEDPDAPGTPPLSCHHHRRLDMDRRAAEVIRPLMFPRNLSRVHLFSSIFSFHCRPTNPTLTMALLALFFFFAIVRAQVTIPARLDGFVYKNGSFSVDSIMIEAFFDPVCPDSRDAWPPLKQILHHYGDRLSLIVHPFALPYHDNAFVSSRALHIVNKLKISVTYDLLELFFKHQLTFLYPATLNYKDLISQLPRALTVFAVNCCILEEFYNQPTFNMSKASIVSRIVNMATEAAGNSYYSSIAAGFTDRKTDLMTRVSFKYGCSRGVFGTPIFFVNGFPLPNGGSAIDYKTWRSIIHPLVNQLGMK
ncbi:unnamed protein product [Camellia sinensis]